MSRTRRWHAVALVCFTAVAVAGCRAGLPIRDIVRAPSPYEQYARSLRQAGLDETALGQEWLAAGERALAAPIAVPVPFGEIAYLPPDEPAAVAYRLELRRGQRFTLEVLHDSPEPARLFMDLFEHDDLREPRRVASAEGGTDHLSFEPSRDGTYLLRLQPELLRGGRYRIEQRIEASLGFPVEGRDSRAVASFFGAARDAGAREHHGIDIFAPRGTPVLAAADGWVSRVETTARGGHVVWVWDPLRGTSLYYAHLDEQLVTSGQRVRRGDVLGTVGNTGNARGTAPHLHFGLYRRGEGPVDPLPYVHEPRTAAAEVTASLDPLGSWSRTTATYRLRAGASTAAPILAELPRHTVLRVEGATSSWYRVSLPDGSRGFLSAQGVGSLEEVIHERRPAAATVVRHRPEPLAAIVAQLDADVAVPVLGTYEDYLLVRTPDGREGWAQLE